MELQKVYAVYFSPTGTTEKTTIAAAKGTGLPGARIDLTPWKSRLNYARVFNNNEVVVVGMPVYGGRLPGQDRQFLYLPQRERDAGPSSWWYTATATTKTP